MPRPGWYRRCMAASSATVPRRRLHRVAGASRTHRRVSVKLPAELVDDIEGRVGPRKVSRYIAASVADSERRLALREFLDRAEEEHGPIPPEAVERARRIWESALEDR